MRNCNRLPEFEKEFSKLSKKYSSLSEDLEKLEKLIEKFPVGFGSNFVIMHDVYNVQVIKVRLACKSLRNRSIRVIYAHHQDTTTFVHIEMYFKGDKENEDRERIIQYLKTVL